MALARSSPEGEEGAGEGAEKKDRGEVGFHVEG